MKTERKETFNEIAQEYDLYRPSYPKELFLDIIKYSKINKMSSILEIGSGTGKATQGFINTGHDNITCIELGADLANLSREKFRENETIEIINGSFEEWNGKINYYDLAISATAFHYINPEAGYPKVASLLKKDGCIAFFWTIHSHQYNDTFTKIRNVYNRYAPEISDENLPKPKEFIGDILKRINDSNLYCDIKVKEYKWLDTYTSDEYISLMNTQSHHQLLEADKREALFSDIRRIIDNSGGVIKKEQLVALFLGRKKSIK